MSPNSLTTARRFLEITSALVHDLASSIHHKLHPAPTKSQGHREDARLEHSAYLFANAYKHENASVVGYWAETDIFGGPMLFAKGQDGAQVCQPETFD